MLLRRLCLRVSSLSDWHPLSSEGALLQGFTVHSRDAADRTGMACCLRVAQNRQASVNVNSLIARNLPRRCSITLLLSVNSISLRLSAVNGGKRLRFSRKWISNGETESEFVSNLTRLRWLIGIFERSVVVDSRGSCIFFFSFFLLQFRSNSTNTFRLFSTFQLSGFNRPSMNFQFYMKLRNFRNRSEATRNRCSY